MEITSVVVEMNETGEGKHAATAEVKFDKILTVRDIRVVKSARGDIMVYFPSRKNKISDSWYDIVSLADKETWMALKEAVIEAYNQVC